MASLKNIRKYSDELEETEKIIYQEKLAVNIGGSIYYCPDPYKLQEGWESRVSAWPPIEFGDLYSFLIESKSRFTKECLKAYKSLEAYNYYACGFVREILYNSIGKETPFCALRAEVTPGQKLNCPPYVPWVITSKSSGEVYAANCTCMAGLGEVCSHVAAVLFKVEAAVSLGYLKESSTSKACVWNKYYNSKVPPCEASKLDFSKPRRKKISRRVNHIYDTPRCPIPTNSLIEELKGIVPDAVFFLDQGFSDTDTASEGEEEENIPTPILSIFRRQQESGALTVEEGRALLENLRASKPQCDKLQEVTVGQRNNATWQRYRKGMITASMAHKVTSCRGNFSVLAERVIAGEPSLGTLPAVAWGVSNEKVALETYVAASKATHINFSLEPVGLFVHPDMPYLGASPDGRRKCDCHGVGLVEVKCPYKFKDCVPFGSHTACGEYFLNTEGVLKVGHKYYTQIQCQLEVANYTFTDFVVWSPKGCIIQTIVKDVAFCQAMIEKISNFALNHLSTKLVEELIK